VLAKLKKESTMNVISKPLALALSAVFSAGLLTGCLDNSNTEEPKSKIGLPEGKTLVFIDASSPKHYSFNTTTEKLTDLNNEAASSASDSVKKLAINNITDIGYFFHWPDFREVNGAEKMDDKYLLMKPGTDLNNTIDYQHFVQLVHYHAEDLAAHTGDEFDSTVEGFVGSSKEAGMTRLNQYREDYQTLNSRVSEALADNTNEQTLCKAYIDPYQAYEKDNYEGMHFAITQSGRIYYYKPDQSDTLVSAQGHDLLTGVTTISDCNRVTITRASDNGILIFIPDTQKIYLVDSHDADYHVHSQWDISKILPSGVRADLMAAIGEGEEHEHEHEHDE
jgi:hypothetical protein